VAIALAAVASSIAMNDAPATAVENLAIGGLGLAYLALLLGAGERLGRAGTGAKVGYFALQLALAAAILALQARLGSFGTVWILLMPLLVQGVVVGTWPGVTALTALALALPTLHALRLAGPEPAFEALVGVGAAILFVLLFSAVTLRERRARAESERLAAQLAGANRRLAELAVQAEELAAARERNRLAREIHDSVGHSLTVANVQIEAAGVHLERERDRERAGAALGKAAGAVKQGLAELRRSVGALRGGPLGDRSLAGALDGLRAEAEAEGLEASVRVLGDPRPIPPETALALFRAAQEGLTNVRKHARAGRVAIGLDYRTAGRVTLTVTDDGVGPRPESDGGFGLFGLSERVELLGGTLNAGPAPAEGFELEVAIPIEVAAGG
jgi:signal transduction histidine kinase